MKASLTLAVAFVLILNLRLFAQNVGINDDGSTPDNSAMLQVKSANKGLLIPQIALTGVNDATTVPSPATSLLVYNTTDGSGLIPGYYYNSGTQGTPVWKALTAIGGLTNFTESNYLYNTKYGVKLLSRNDAQTDVDFVISPKGNGSILAQQPDGTSAGGKIRGLKAVDFQMLRSSPTQVASGNLSFAAGNSNTASGTSSFAVGGANTASGAGSFVVGSNNTASEQYSIAIGGQNHTSGESSFAVGYNNTASGSNSTAIGLVNTSSGQYATAIGANNTSSGDRSFASGYLNTAQSFGETALGINATVGTGDPTSFVSTDRLFVIGNGSDNGRSDALSILKNGNTRIGGSLIINGNGKATSLTLPATRGTSGNVLTTDGIGGTSWTTPAGGTVTGVTGTAPIVSSGGNAPAISISAATTSAAGSMSAADKTKVDNLVSSQWITSGSNIYYASGNVGIGITPVYPLNFGSTLGDKISLFGTATNHYGLGVQDYKLQIYTVSSNSDVVFGYGSSASLTETMRIKGNGQIVIPALTTKGVLLNDASGVVSSTIGTNGQVLTTNSSGGVGWTTHAVGTVTDVTGTAPIVSSGGVTPAISISAATTSAAGSMSAADKTKLDAQTTGTATGQMQYWNGSAWVTVTAGINGQLLKYKNGVPTWVDDQIENLNIGDSYQGGVIAYFFQSGDPGYVAGEKHGLIAAVADVSNAAWYDFEHTITISTGTALGTGSANTVAILAAYTGSYNYAAKVCANYERGGYTDWFLPSKAELDKLYLNRNAIGGFATGSYSFYYSSSQSGSLYAWALDFSTGSSAVRMVQNADRVRPVRVF